MIAGRLSAYCARAALAALTAALAACAVGPNFKRPSPPAATGYGSAPVQGQTTTADTAGGNAQPGRRIWDRRRASRGLCHPPLDEGLTVVTARAMRRESWA